MSRGSVLLDGEAQTIAAVDPGRIGTVLNLGVTAGSLGAVGSGSFAVSAAAAADQHWRVGSRVPVVTPTAPGPGCGWRPSSTIPDITGDYLFAAAGWAPHAGQPLDSMVLITLKPGAGLGPARAAVTAAGAGDRPASGAGPGAVPGQRHQRRQHHPRAGLRDAGAGHRHRADGRGEHASLSVHERTRSSACCARSARPRRRRGA